MVALAHSFDDSVKRSLLPNFLVMGGMSLATAIVFIAMSASAFTDPMLKFLGFLSLIFLLELASGFFHSLSDPSFHSGPAHAAAR